MNARIYGIRQCVICGTDYKSSHKNIVCCSMKCQSLNKTRKAQIRVETRFNKPIYNLLYDLYYVDNMGLKKLANHIGVSNHVLWDWFETLGIPRRNRSEAVKLQWLNNDKRKQKAALTAKAAIEKNPEANNARLLQNRRDMQSRTEPTSIERKMMNALDALSIGYDFQFEVGGKFHCDLFIHNTNLIIECDGDYWHNTPTQKAKDKVKDKYLMRCGYIVLRFSGTKINQDLDRCIETIRMLIHR